MDFKDYINKKVWFKKNELKNGVGIIKRFLYDRYLEVYDIEKHKYYYCELKDIELYKNNKF